jgi:hypothetical protein
LALATHVLAWLTNVLLASDLGERGYRALLSDFGLSTVLRDSTHHTSDCIGTIAFMPPEAFNAGQVSVELDIYSFGMLRESLAEHNSLYVDSTRLGISYSSLYFLSFHYHRLKAFSRHHNVFSLLSTCFTSPSFPPAVLHMFHGSTPFHATAAAHVIGSKLRPHKHDALIDAALEGRSGLPPPPLLAELIRQCTAINRTERPDIRNVLDVLRRMLDGY